MQLMIESIGLLGGLLLAVCGLPAAIAAIRTGTSEINSGMLWLWFGGEVLMLAYVLATFPAIPLLINYIFNIILLLILVRYKHWPREENET